LALPAHRRAGDASRRVRIVATFEQRHIVVRQEEVKVEVWVNVK
jgi:hypothetical protein